VRHWQNLKPRTVLGIAHWVNEFQRANISGEDDNADARGYTRKRRGHDHDQWNKDSFGWLEYGGIIERTGEMGFDEHSREWQPVYTFTELGRALSGAGIGFDEYQNSQIKGQTGVTIGQSLNFASRFMILTADDRRDMSYPHCGLQIRQRAA
jgi:hypothetical protein